MTHSFLPVFVSTALFLAVPHLAVCDDAAPVGKATKKEQRTQREARQESEFEQAEHERVIAERERAEAVEREERELAERRESAHIEREHAEAVEREGREHAERENRERVEREHRRRMDERENRLHHLREAAEHLALAGKHELAQNVRREAEEIEGARQQEAHPADRETQRPELAELHQMLRQLGEAVDRLHQRVNELEQRR